MSHEAHNHKAGKEAPILLQFVPAEPSTQRRDAIPHHRASFHNRLERRRMAAIDRKVEKRQKAARWAKWSFERLERIWA